MLLDIISELQAREVGYSKGSSSTIKETILKRIDEWQLQISGYLSNSDQQRIVGMRAEMSKSKFHSPMNLRKRLSEWEALIKEMTFKLG